MFIYNVADVGPATLFGTYPREAYAGDLSPPLSHSAIADPLIPLDHVQSSVAPLQDVISIQVLEDERKGQAIGVLLDYSNGAQRALGNCRLDAIRVKKYWKPSRICYLNFTDDTTGDAVGPLGSSQQALRHPFITAGDDLDHSHDHDGEHWVCNPLRGRLECWFAIDHSSVRVVE